MFQKEQFSQENIFSESKIFFYSLLICLVIFVLTACGSKSSPSEAVGPFDAFKENSEVVGTPLLCEKDPSKSGCAKVQASGSAVGGQFIFDDLLVSCSQKVNGYEILFSNSVVDSNVEAVFLGKIGFLTSELTRGAKVCVGFLYNEQGVVDSKSCLVGFRFSGSNYWTDNSTACSVFISSINPIKGSLECKDLFEGGKNLHISKSSRFACQTKN